MRRTSCELVRSVKCILKDTVFPTKIYINCNILKAWIRKKNVIYRTRSTKLKTSYVDLSWSSGYSSKFILCVKVEPFWVFHFEFLLSSSFVLSSVKQICAWQSNLSLRPIWQTPLELFLMMTNTQFGKFQQKIITLYNFLILDNTGFGGSPVIINGSAWVYSWFVPAGNVILMALFTWHMSAKALHPQQRGGRFPFMPSWMVVCFCCRHSCVLGRLTKAL